MIQDLSWITVLRSSSARRVCVAAVGLGLTLALVWAPLALAQTPQTPQTEEPPPQDQEQPPAQEGEQDEEAPPEEPLDERPFEEEITVTGTRVEGRSAADTPAPVDYIDAETIQSTGATETGKILQLLAPSFNFSTTFISDGTDIIRPATLRALGPRPGPRPGQRQAPPPAGAAERPADHRAAARRATTSTPSPPRPSTTSRCCATAPPPSTAPMPSPASSTSSSRTRRTPPTSPSTRARPTRATARRS